MRAPSSCRERDESGDGLIDGCEDGGVQRLLCISQSAGVSCCSSTPFSARMPSSVGGVALTWRVEPLQPVQHRLERLVVDDDAAALALRDRR